MLAVLAFLAFATTFAQILLLDRYLVAILCQLLLPNRTFEPRELENTFILKNTSSRVFGSWLLGLGLFLLRFALVLFGLYSFLMATIFNRFIANA